MAVIALAEQPASDAETRLTPLPLPLPNMLPSPPADATRLNLASSIEINYWCQLLNCTETRLRNAVLAVGPLAADVRAYLQR